MGDSVSTLLFCSFLCISLYFLHFTINNAIFFQGKIHINFSNLVRIITILFFILAFMFAHKLYFSLEMLPII